MFKFFIQVDDHGTEWYIHQIVDAKAPIEGDSSLIFVHMSYNILSCDSYHLRAYEL